MKRRWATLVAAALAMNVFVLPGAVQASTTEAIADTGGMTLLLGVPGAPLDIAVTLDEIGHITEVLVSDPTFSEDRGGDHKVRFSNEDDTTRVEIKAKNNKLRAAVKTADLASILGAHTWKAALFASGQETEVTFEVADDGAGNPVLENVAVGALFPTDATAEVGDVKTEVDDEEAESSVKVDFLWNGYKMTLKIKAEVEFDDDDDDDDDRHVTLKVELKGKDQQRLRDMLLEDLLGTYTWDVNLCDGTDVAVTYTIAEPGTVTVDEVTMAGIATDAYELKVKNHGFDLRFDDSKARLSVDLKNHDGSWDLKVKSKTTEKCKDHDDDDDDDEKKKDHDDSKKDDDDHDGDDD